MANIKWTTDMRDRIAELWDSHSQREIAQILGVPEDRLKGQVKAMRYKYGYNLTLKKRHNVKLTKEEVIDLIIRYPTEAEYLNNKATLPPINVVRNFFGSWTNARIEAGLGPSKGVWKDSDTLSVYVIHFIDEDFYKFGVTKRTIKQRFASYPPFEIIYETILPKVEALNLEKIFKSQAFSCYKKYIPQNSVFHGASSKHGGGKDECFKT